MFCQFSWQPFIWGAACCRNLKGGAGAALAGLHASMHKLVHTHIIRAISMGAIRDGFDKTRCWSK